MPCTIIIIIIICCLSISNTGFDFHFIKKSSKLLQQITYPFLYFGLNIFTCFPISQEFAPSLTKKDKIKAPLIVASILSLTIILIQFAILRESSNFSLHEIPTLILVVEKFPSLGILIATAIAVGIITTILSCGFIVKSAIVPKVKNNLLASITPLVFGYFLSLLGFSTIVKYLYPLIGSFGFVLTVYTTTHQIRAKLKKKRTLAAENYKIQ